MSTRCWAFALAVTATATALCMSVLAGWQRGGALVERLVWIAIGLVLVLSAHLLPSLLRGMPVVVRATGNVLWVTCLATACIGHAVFFLTAQQHAGARRASSAPVGQAPVSGRSLHLVMAERASVTAQLTSANARYCTGNCVTLEGRRTTLAARIDALNAEADDIRRQQTAMDRVTTQRDALLVDPVTSRLAALLGTTTTRIDLLSGLMFAAVLEGVACLLWAVALRTTPVTTPVPGVTPPVPSTVKVTPDVTQPEVTPVTANHANATVSRETAPAHGDATGSHAQQDDPLASPAIVDTVDDELPRLARDVSAGLLRPTVAGIRRYLGCSQARATALRRQLAERDITA
ncbi:hypothetical protein BL243_12275 [Ralstonia solanacearum]|nr:hypothetical protein BL243_12275 [Ralstonia solanacearum]